MARQQEAAIDATQNRDPDAKIEPEATVFTNIAPGSAEVVRPWVDALRNVGFAVFAKPKIDEDSDVDDDIQSQAAIGRVIEDTANRIDSLAEALRRVRN